MGLKKLVATDLGMAQMNAYLNRPFLITATGTGTVSHTIPQDDKFMATITDIVLSGNGVFTVKEGDDTILEVAVSGTFTYSPKASLNVDLKNVVTFTFTGEGQLRINVLGYFVRK